jgi:Asparagine synthase (glutamine-hydrolyzing)
MCGLLAYLSTDTPRVTESRVDDVREALHCLHHRGPDDTAVWSDESVVLGFNRLSIIDVEGSPQPLPYAGDRYRILFNGEIYNYVELREELAAAGAQLATHGDTETIVAGYHLWGQDVVRRLRGMFSFVIWDTQTRTAFGAATRSASSRCSPRAWPTAGWSSARRRRRCCSCWAAARRPAASTRPRCSTT